MYYTPSYKNIRTENLKKLAIKYKNIYPKYFFVPDRLLEIPTLAVPFYTTSISCIFARGRSDDIYTTDPSVHAEKSEPYSTEPALRTPLTGEKIRRDHSRSSQRDEKHLGVACIGAGKDMNELVLRL